MSTLSTKNGCNSKGHPITKNEPLHETHQRQHPNHECQAFKRRPLRRKHVVQFHSLPFPSQQCNPSNIRSPSSSSSSSPSASCCCCSSISHHPRHQYNTKIHRHQQSTSTPANTSKLSAATTTPRKSPILTLLLSLAVLLISTPISTTLASSNTEINRCPLRPPPSISRAPLILGHRGASFHLPEHSMVRTTTSFFVENVFKK